MSLSSLWKRIHDLIPHPKESVEAIEAIAEAADEFIAVLKARLPEVEGKTEAIAAVNQAVTHSNIALAAAAHQNGDSSPGSAS